MSYGTITWEDAKGGRTSTRIKDVTSAAALQTLAGVLVGYSNAIWTNTRVDDPNGAPGTATDGEHRTVKTKCTIIMRDSNGDICKVSIPAPQETIYSYDGGNRVLAGANGTTITTAVATATGKTLTFVKARHRSEPGQG